MSSSSEHLTRGRVLSGAVVSPPVADLGVVSSRAARTIVVSPELVEGATREGYAAGHAQGFENGYGEGLAQGREHAAKLAGLVQRLSAAADALAAREATARADIEDQVVETACEIAAALVGHVLAEPSTAARGAIARALALAPDHGLVIVHMNPADLAVIGDTGPLAAGRMLELVADGSIAAGDCVVEVGACRVDARIDAALERVREAFS
jgi:flagellar assembly protein FliH